MLKIDGLHVTQHELRYLDQIPQMVEFIKQEGVWHLQALLEHAERYHPGRVSPLIQISRFPDGLEFIHDGHHRLVTTWIGGRKVIFPEEYEVTNWTYEEYLEINIPVGWYTPFDPRTHCRRPDLHDFKSYIRSMVDTTDHSKIEEIIRNSLSAYCEPRRFQTVAEMAKHLCLVV